MAVAPHRACRALLVLCALALQAGGLQAAASTLDISRCKLDLSRLPKGARPVHYKLELSVDPDAPDFRGRVEISVQLSETGDLLCRKHRWWQHELVACDRAKIILHADNGLEFSEIAYEELGESAELAGPPLRIESVCRDETQDLLAIKFSRALGRDSRGKLRFAYTGHVRADFVGLFRAEQQLASVREDGKRATSALLATQLESAHARKLLPSFDEPEFKATFELTVERPADLVALANMEPVREEEEELEELAAGGESGPAAAGTQVARRIKRTTFARTPRMSTYLLALAVGRFEHIETRVGGAGGSSPMTLRVHFGEGRARDAAPALEDLARAYPALERFFGPGAPGVGKLDFLAISDFPGAMENWGLILIEESNALLERDKSLARESHWSRVMLVHEMAHQWFGNMVTMRWWDDLWLNEGFASWLSNELVDELYPELESRYIYLTKSVCEALSADADRYTSHPIKNGLLKSVDDIEESFDEIAYDKANAVIGMLRDFMGADKFRLGLRHYIREHAYANTDDSDLWRALEATNSGQQLDIERLMRTWIQQAGFPLITVNWSPEHKRTLRVRQKRFPAPQDKAPGPLDKLGARLPGRKQAKWQVPVSMWVAGGREHPARRIEFVLTHTSDSIELPDWFDARAPGHWLKLNSQFEGFYRVRYESSALVEALRRAIESKHMGPADRLQVLEESLGLYWAEKLSREQLAERIVWFRDEEHDAVLQMLARCLQWIDVSYAEDVLNLHASLVNHYLKNGRLADVHTPSLLKSMARTAVVGQLVRAQHPTVIGDALQLFDSTRGQVPEFVREEIFCAVARAGSDEQFARMLQLVGQLDVKRIKRFIVHVLKDAVKGNPERLDAVHEVDNEH